MLETEKIEFLKLMQKTFQIYKTICDKETVKLFWEILKEWELEEIRKALEIYMAAPKNGQFLPKPINISNILSEMPSGMARKGLKIAIDAISLYGPYASIGFEDLSINASIIDIGGWEEFCTNYSQLEKEFIKHYKKYNSAINPMLPRYVPGKMECYNKKNGHCIPRFSVIHSPRCLTSKEIKNI